MNSPRQTLFGSFDPSNYFGLLCSFSELPIRGALLYSADGLSHPLWNHNFPSVEYWRVCDQKGIIPFSELHLRYDPSRCSCDITMSRKREYDSRTGNCVVSEIQFTENSRFHEVYVDLHSPESIRQFSSQRFNVTTAHPSLKNYPLQGGFFTFSNDGRTPSAVLSFGRYKPRSGIELVFRREGCAKIVNWFSEHTGIHLE
ncbi:TPA: hypothetical protein HA241_02535 [Candidatus Woesearchaeota archaeon]|nr:hypothetical protein [Candidatus Woesearchaeota archaeon]